MKLKIAKEDDRLTVAAILIKNGYTVKQGKQLKGNSKSTYESYLYAELEGKNDL
jgi:hypothetical protein